MLNRVKMKIRKINKNKKGLSEMISYVLLIAIAIGISTGVFVWLKSMANVNPVVDCEEGTSVLMEDYSCRCDNQNLCLITMDIKNNGRFNVSGIILTISIDSKEPTQYLIQKEDQKKTFAGYQFFIPPLNPGSTQKAEFLNIIAKDDSVINKITSIKIQPIIYVKKSRVVCKNSIIKQQIDCSF